MFKVVNVYHRPIIVILVPKLFLMAYNFLKKFLAPETADKFIIYDSELTILTT